MLLCTLYSSKIIIFSGTKQVQEYSERQLVHTFIITIAGHSTLKPGEVSFPQKNKADVIQHRVEPVEIFPSASKKIEWSLQCTD